MGTIAEMLGLDLSETLGSGDAAIDEDGPAGGADAVEDPEETPSAGDPVGEAVMAAVLAETSLDPGDARADLLLTGPELDLDRLGRWSVAAAIERDLKAAFRDADVEELQTLGDLLDAARALSPSSGAGRAPGGKGRSVS